MVKNYSDSERGNPLPPHGLRFPISSKGSFICTIPQTYHGLCYTSRGALAGTRNSSMGLGAGATGSASVGCINLAPASGSRRLTSTSAGRDGCRW